MDYLNRISRPGSVTSFSQQQRHGADGSVHDDGWTSRGKGREAIAPPDGRAFASILARLIDG